MTGRTALIIITMAYFTQPICEAGLARNNVSPTLSTPANLSYEELSYIFQQRNGIETTRPKVLTPCARAILGCCKEKVMNEYCSEALQCGAFFFDVNPCEEKFVIDALRAARAFYEQFNSVKR